jgi:organic hydroperoxide reductase OsmC/OhrA
LKSNAIEKDFQLAKKLASKAEGSCMISRALKGNVEIELEANIEKAQFL